MLRSWVAALGAAGIAFAATSAPAAVLLQTASSGLYQGSVSIFDGSYSSTENPQWLGVRFSLAQDAHIDGIGADFDYFEGSLFGAIVALSDNVTDLPDGDPFLPGEVLGYITFSGGDPLYAFDLDLIAGNYGLIFGSGLYGTHGFSGIRQTEAVDPSASFFFYGNQGHRPNEDGFWQQGMFHGTQFTVTGELTGVVTPPTGPTGPGVPEPSTWGLMLMGFAGLGLIRRRQKGQLGAA